MWLIQRLFDKKKLENKKQLFHKKQCPIYVDKMRANLDIYRSRKHTRKIMNKRKEH